MPQHCDATGIWVRSSKQMGRRRAWDRLKPQGQMRTNFVSSGGCRSRDSARNLAATSPSSSVAILSRSTIERAGFANVAGQVAFVPALCRSLLDGLRGAIFDQANGRHLGCSTPRTIRLIWRRPSVPRVFLTSSQYQEAAKYGFRRRSTHDREIQGFFNEQSWHVHRYKL